MKCDKSSLRNDLLLYAVTDRTWLNGRSLSDCVRDSLRGGVTFVQLREKDLQENIFLQEARELKSLCAEFNAPFVVNDNVQIAKEVDADGVHIGQSDMALAKARAILGNDKIIGVSATTVQEALLAQKGGADYLGVGAVFSTNSKADAKNVSFATLKEICEAVKIPVVAIGGINAMNVFNLKNSGIAGVSVISAIFAASDICQAAVDLKESLREVIC